MATASRGGVPPWVMLDREVLLDTVAKDRDWSVIRSEKSQAYITIRRDFKDDRDDELSPFDGLSLLVRLADPPYPSSICIRLDGDPEAPRRGFSAYLGLADDGLLVLNSCLPDLSGDRSYIVADSADGSIAMAPTLDPSYRFPFSYQPLPVRHRNGGSGCTLALMAIDLYGDDNQELLYVRPSSLPFDQPWCCKKVDFPADKPEFFTADEMFVFQGRAFWVNLGQGLLSCSCEDIVSDCSDVQFSYIPLPKELQVDSDSDLSNKAQPSEYRAMRCVGDSIKFVSLDGYNSAKYYTDIKISMWTLIPSTRQWSSVGGLCLGTLWEQYDFRKSGMPSYVLPCNPMISTEEDGVVYFILRECYVDEEQVLQDGSMFVFSLNLNTNKLVSSTPLPPCRYTGPSPFFCSDFFKHLQRKNLQPLVCPREKANVFPNPAKRDRGDTKVLPALSKRAHLDHLEASRDRAGMAGMEGLPKSNEKVSMHDVL